VAILLGIDTGGTYTDAVLFDEEAGVIASAKALTTKHDLSIGIRRAVERVLPNPPPDVHLVSLSTTLATNAIVEGQGSPICLLLLGYPTDALDRAGLRQALGDDPVVFINGGHTVVGEEQMPLDLDAARRAIQSHAPQVAAFAVSGYFAVRNPAHELVVRDLVRELTGSPVTCGHELTSNLHAPRRALTAALNARLISLLQQLILAVRDMLAEKAVHAPLMVVKGDGSLIEAQVALERPVETILSGPAASVVGARRLSARTMCSW
jgi:N-methylhydantoinase A/oxoprolinase/acetone carboxylase beta subunit